MQERARREAAELAAKPLIPPGLVHLLKGCHDPNLLELTIRLARLCSPVLRRCRRHLDGAAAVVYVAASVIEDNVCTVHCVTERTGADARETSLVAKRMMVECDWRVNRLTVAEILSVWGLRVREDLFAAFLDKPNLVTSIDAFSAAAALVWLDAKGNWDRMAQVTGCSFATAARTANVIVHAVGVTFFFRLWGLRRRHECEDVLLRELYVLRPAYQGKKHHPIRLHTPVSVVE